MDWSPFTTPTGTAIIATVGSFLAGLDRRCDYLANDARNELGEAGTDKELATKKAEADIALVREKFQLDASLADRKRRQSLAEEALESFYRVRVAI
jgi:hypothetical protein